MKNELPSLDDDLRPRPNLKAIRSAPEPVTVQDEGVASLRIEVPIYLDREIAMKAAAERVTKQFLVIKALADAGFHVEPEDMVPDKRKAKR